MSIEKPFLPFDTRFAKTSLTRVGEPSMNPDNKALQSVTVISRILAFSAKSGKELQMSAMASRSFHDAAKNYAVEAYDRLMTTDEITTAAKRGDFHFIKRALSTRRIDIDYVDDIRYLIGKRQELGVIDMGLDANANLGVTMNIDYKKYMLHIAIEHCSVEFCQALIDRGANVNQEDSQKWRAIHYAARNGDPSIIKMLIDNGAEINVFRRWSRVDPYVVDHPIVIALNRDNPSPAVNALIDNGARLEGVDGIIEKLSRSRYKDRPMADMMRRFIEVGAGFRDSIKVADSCSLIVNLAEWLVLTQPIMTPEQFTYFLGLGLRLNLGDSHIVKALVKKPTLLRALIDYDRTYLTIRLFSQVVDIISADNRMIASLYVLIEMGALKLSCIGTEGRNPLSIAISVKDDELLEKLLSAGFDPNEISALHVAVTKEYTTGIMKLLYHGAALWHLKPHEDTVIFGNLEVLTFVKNHCPERVIQDFRRQAQQMNRQNIIDFFKR